MYGAGSPKAVTVPSAVSVTSRTRRDSPLIQVNRRHPGPGQFGPDHLAGRAAGEPGRDHVMAEGVQHLRHRQAPTSGR